jgi:ethanolamine ammonia-lyase small subunit
MVADPWLTLRATTRARIGLGRTGDAPPLAHLLDFQLAHATARDAVHTPLDVAAVAGALAPLRTIAVRSRAADRATYLRRPDLGRALDPACHRALAGSFDVVFVLADGLSPIAVQRHAPAVLHACLGRLPGWSIGPIVIATQARVALGDDIGARLNATLCAVLIGERPGLSVADSLGIYLTYQPTPGRLDSERNCISNIHGDGLSHEAAADMLAWLLREARHHRLTGVGLKDDRSAAVAEARQRGLPGYAAPR